MLLRRYRVCIELLPIVPISYFRNSNHLLFLANLRHRECEGLHAPRDACLENNQNDWNGIGLLSRHKLCGYFLLKLLIIKIELIK